MTKRKEYEEKTVKLKDKGLSYVIFNMLLNLQLDRYKKTYYETDYVKHMLK